MPNSPFADEWRDCLRAQYIQVVRNADQKQERGLRTVLVEAGFSEDEIKTLFIQATMRNGDVE